MSLVEKMSLAGCLLEWLLSLAGILGARDGATDDGDAVDLGDGGSAGRELGLRRLVAY